MISYFKNHPHHLIIILILILALFFRTYKVVERFEFAHDGDLYSWMVKDIVINHHFRLVGQETSASGIFIGPLFYYLITPFFILTNMDPLGAVIPITIIGILTVLSYYFVFAKLFNVKIGLIAAFLYAVLLSQLDRWVVPSTPSNLWTIWYFYVILMLARGNFSLLPILGVLIGLIWHIHIVLIPSLLAIPFAIFLSGKFPNLRQMVYFLIALIITSLPLIIFEVKHNFQQFFNILSNFSAPREGAEGFYKFQLVLDMIIKNINILFFAPHSLKLTDNILFPSIILLSAVYLIKKSLLKINEYIPLITWILGVIVFFSITSSPISEYYFHNIEVIFLAIISLLFYSIFRSSIWGKRLSLGILLLVAIKNILFFVTQNHSNNGYVERKAVVDYIVSDAESKNFPCFSINYITSPGENVGFRYFFYLKGAKLAVAGNGSPVYSIVIPIGYSQEVEKKFGHIGIITPKEIRSRAAIDYACSGLNTNLTDPMFGYVE